MGITLDFLPELDIGSHLTDIAMGESRPDLSAYTRDNPILLTDDEPHIITLYEYILGRHNLHYVSTDDGLDALHICRKRPISLIISDLNKPGISGLEILRQLRADPMTRHIQFMLVTATPSSEVHARFIQLGGDSWMVKPVQIASFAATIERLVQHHLECYA